MREAIVASLAQETPPADLSELLQALWWLKKGALKTGAAWQRAHEICQNGEGNRPYDLVHALVHLIEGDSSNAAYWYRRAGVQQGHTDLAAEWEHIVDTLSG